MSQTLGRVATETSVLLAIPGALSAVQPVGASSTLLCTCIASTAHLLSTAHLFHFINLELVTSTLRQTYHEQAAVVLSQDDVGLNKHLSGLCGQEWRGLVSPDVVKEKLALLHHFREVMQEG